MSQTLLESRKTFCVCMVEMYVTKCNKVSKKKLYTERLGLSYNFTFVFKCMLCSK